MTSPTSVVLISLPSLPALPLSSPPAPRPSLPHPTAGPWFSAAWLSWLAGSSEQSGRTGSVRPSQPDSALRRFELLLFPLPRSGPGGGVGQGPGRGGGAAGVVLVPIGDDRVGHAPVGADGGVVPRHPELVVRVVVAVDQVPKGQVGERSEAMGHAGGNEQATVVIAVEVDGQRRPIGGRAGPP